MNNGLKILSIYHVGDNPEDNFKVALNGSSIKMVISRDVEHLGRDLKQVSVCFIDGEIETFRISGLDLMTLEEVVAGYSADF